MKPFPVGDGGFRSDQDDILVHVEEPQNKHLGHEGADLPGWKVHNGSHLRSDQVFGFVVLRDLGRGFLLSQLFTKINEKLIGRLARFREVLNGLDRSNTNIKF